MTRFLDWVVPFFLACLLYLLFADPFVARWLRVRDERQAAEREAARTAKTADDDRG